jgi:FPC/CPF motif-containing protein YcgG
MNRTRQGSMLQTIHVSLAKPASCAEKCSTPSSRGASPTYKQRHSRNLGPGIVIIFQPRILFIDPSTSQPIAAEVRHRIHKRMLAYDGMPVHPDIGFYGQTTNHEWKQYALPDDNSPEAGRCPFHPRNS